MTKKKKNAARKQQAVERPPSLEDNLDYELHSSDEEREVTEEGAVANLDPKEKGDVANSTSMEVSSPSSAKERSPSQSSPSDVEETALETVDDLNVEQLQILLFKAEAKARLRGLSKKEKSPPTLSEGTVQFLRGRTTVSEALPIESAGSALSRLTTSESPRTYAAHEDDIGTPAEQEVGETKESFASTSNPASSSLSSVTPAPSSLPSATQPSLESTSYRDAVAAPLYHDVAAVSVTTADLRCVPKLTGASDQNVTEILDHFRIVVGLKAKRVRPNDEKFADIVALEHIALLGSGHCLTLIQQLLTGQIDTRTASVDTEPEDRGSFTAPQTWQEMTRALLDLLMPANSVDECAREIATFTQKSAETVSAYAMRFRTVLSQFKAAVDRLNDKRAPWNALTVALWQQGLKPNVRCLMLNDKPVTSLKAAIDSARRHEASNLAGGHISALFQQVPHRRPFDPSVLTQILLVKIGDIYISGERSVA